MYFDFHYYRQVLGFVLKQKQWPKRTRMLLRLLLWVPAMALCNNLFLLLDYLLFPSLWFLKVRQPVFIVGHARSGTTMLHRLMAADTERFSYFLYWEMFFPSIAQRKLIGWLGWLDRRFFSASIKQRLAAWDEKTFGPWRHIHEQGLWIPEEDQFVMQTAFVTQQWALDLPLMHEVDIFHIDALSEARRRAWMKFYKECVKRQLLINGGDRIHLSKNPVFSGWLSAILETFPDAKIIVMLRDPLQCIPSTLKLVEMTWRGGGWRAEDYADSMQALIRVSFDCFTLPRQVLSDKAETPQVFVDYRDLTADPGSTVENIYTALGIHLAPAYSHFLYQEQGLARQHQTHYRYSIEEFDISPSEIVARLQPFYTEYGWPLPEVADTEGHEQTTGSAKTASDT